MTNLTDEDNKKIENAKKKYEEASARGDTAGMESAHAEAESVRANYGYSGGDDGSQHIKLNNGSWIGDPTVKDTYSGTRVDNSTYKDDLDKLTEAQRKAQTEALKKAKQQALYNLDVQEQKVKPMYQEKRNTASTTSQQNARSFAEYLANRGLTSSGASAQGEINRQSTLQNILGNIDTSEAKAFRDIDNQRTAIENNYVSDLANANASIDAQYYSNLLAYNEQQRQQTEALRQQSLYQYANDYQARINDLLAQGYNENSREILELRALRGQKIAQQQSAISNNALTYLQMGYSDYQVANALGLSLDDVKSIAQHYKQLNDNNLQLSNQELINANLSNQYLKKQITNYGTSKSSSSSSNSSTGLSYTKLNSAINEILNNITKDTAAEKKDTIRQNAANYLIENAKSLIDLANIANAQSLTVEQIAKAMLNKGYSESEVLTVAETMMGQTISQDYLEKILEYAGG